MSNLPGVRALHNLIGLHNPGGNALMEVRDSCYGGPLKDKPITANRSWLDLSCFALSRVIESYFASNNLSEAEMAQVQHVCKFLYPLA